MKNIPRQVLQEAENVGQEADEVERLIELGKKEEQAKAEIKQALETVK